MFRTLLESNAPRQRRRASTLASVVVHTAAIAGAVVATASAKTRAPRLVEPPEPEVFYVPTPTARTKSKAPSRSDPRPTRQITRPYELPWNIRYAPSSAITPPTGVDPSMMLASDTILGPAGGPGPIGGEMIGPAPGNEPATVATVDKAAAMLVTPRPRYPDLLRRAGVTGRVVVRLVVDTTGRVEPASVVIRESSHDFFGQAVRAVLPSLRFAAAEAGGRKVRMLVDLPFEFRLQK